eukprot:TRINITY_DN27_c0_g1_i1.p1 TRINITY_DN27_c0_g1~~TRINITY_DN27_c0_g1_i1.p1  ORF type:complete len:617 (-),score=160.11 TRINITY_DN27_c0_g1_i1:495-2345(-)
MALSAAALLRRVPLQTRAALSRCISSSIASHNAPAKDAYKEHKLSFARGLFLGKIQTSQAFPYPDTLDEETRDTIRQLVDPVEKFFATKVNSAEIDRAGKIPAEVLDGLKELGLYGLQIPQDLNGLGLSNTAYARIAEIVCQDGSIAVTMLAHQSIGLKGILLNGNDEQKKKYLPRLATGEHTAAFALTEPTSGSDAASIRTRAVLSPDKKHFILNGNKIWISNGGYADIMTVFAQTEVDGKDKVTAFIVERAFGGISAGKPEDKLGIRGSNTCAVYFENCKVPIENVLGEVGSGFKVAMNILNNGRFGLGAGSASMMKHLLAMITEHATTRKQFGKTLQEFELIKEKFGNIAIDAYGLESMVYMTTAMIDRGDSEPYIEAAMCKIYGSEASWKAVNEGIQVMGGMGFMKDYPYERMMRDTRILSIFEGTNEILRMLVALTGLKLVGDDLKSLLKAIKSPLANKDRLKVEAYERTIGRMNVKPLAGVHPNLQACGDSLQSATIDFHHVNEKIVRTYKEKVIEQQIILRRVADVSMDLFAMTAAISRATRALSENYATAAHEEKLCIGFCKKAIQRINANIREINVGAKHNGDKEAVDVANDIFANKKYIATHPIGV